jgi:hypothetical protein
MHAKPIAGKVSEKSFRHLAAARIARAEDKNIWLVRHGISLPQHRAEIRSGVGG